ncbi:hypothetical protein D9757_004331 [Collybiopsis confluens]|uniref:Transcriptional regulator n=1 Tax=Collybiopsis confluens TaxID=2823264 RepID=A0A8H5MCJ2_9AGAR|nr:hypothetical protein D9757_004331 [Collybiopsis confluens]
MYLRQVHEEADLDALHSFIRENPLGILTTAIDSPSYPFLQSSHIPWILDRTDEAKIGVLRGHMARANPQAKALIEALEKTGTAGPGKLDRDVLVLFNNPVHHYVTPKFYTQTKPTTGKVVSTWNYAAVQVYGKLTVYYRNDSATASFLTAQTETLTEHAETQIMGFEQPWRITDAPESYIELLKNAIIGVEITIEDIGGKFKMSQEMPQGDREGVIAGFASMGSETTTKLSELVKRRGEMADEKKRK